MSDTLSTTPVDLAIIGAGPIGLFAAFYAGLRQMSVMIVDSLDMLGGQLVTLYPEKYIYDVPGFPRIVARQLADNLIQQGLQYGAITRLGEQVRTLDWDEATGCYRLGTSKATHLARTIIIAAGVGAFTPKRLPLAGVERFQGRGLDYFVSSIDSFREQRVLIVGGGDSAVDWANMLAPVASQLTIIHRREQFRAHEDSVARMRASRARILTPYELKAIAGDGMVRQAIVYHNSSHSEETIEVDRVLVNIGFETSLGPIRDWGLQIQGGQIVVDGSMRASRPGVFAAGDVCTYPGKLKLIATGFGEACTAVNFAKVYLDPQSSLFPGHSSNLRA